MHLKNINTMRPLLLMIILLTTNYCYAYRCGQSIVSTGAYYQHVLKLCGEPDSKTHYTENECNWSVITRMRYCASVDVDILTYIRYGMTNRLIFHNKQLKHIKSCREC